MVSTVETPTDDPPTVVPVLRVHLGRGRAPPPQAAPRRRVPGLLPLRLRRGRRRPHHRPRPRAHRLLLGEPVRHGLRAHPGEGPAARRPGRRGHRGHGPGEPGRVRDPLRRAPGPPRRGGGRALALALRQGLLRRSAARSTRSPRTTATSTRTTRSTTGSAASCSTARRATASPTRSAATQGGDPAQPRAADRRPVGRRGRVVVHPHGALLPGHAARRGRGHPGRDRRRGGAPGLLASRARTSPVGSRSSRCTSRSSKTSPTCSTSDARSRDARRCRTRRRSPDDRDTFARMDESTREQWDHIARRVDRGLGERPRPHPRRCCARSAGVTNGFAVDQLTHVCQTAARAERAGADDEVVVAALCHDIAKAVSEPNHPAVAAALLKPYVRAGGRVDGAGPPGLPGPALLRVHGQGPGGASAVRRPPGVRARRAVRRRVGPDVVRPGLRHAAARALRAAGARDLQRAAVAPDSVPARMPRREVGARVQRRVRDRRRGDAARPQAQPAEADPADRWSRRRRRAPPRAACRAWSTDDRRRSPARRAGCSAGADVPEPERDRADDAARAGGRRRAGRSPRITPRKTSSSTSAVASGMRTRSCTAASARTRRSRGRPGTRCRCRSSARAVAGRPRRSPPADGRTDAQAATRGRGGRTRDRAASAPTPRARARPARPRRRRRPPAAPAPAAPKCDDRPEPERQRGRRQVQPDPVSVTIASP